MNTPEESLNDQDPDYVSATSDDQAQQKIHEENARNTTARKITTIVEKEFSQEIDLKEKEILQIQERLHKALKTLHFLRYVIITDFYNRKQCQLPQTTETCKQTRIHPAIKSLLGKSPKFEQCADPAVPSTSTDPRFLSNNHSFVSDTKIAVDCPSRDEEYTNRSNAAQVEKRKQPDEESRPRKMPRYVPPKSSIPSADECPSRSERHKIRKRIIVGNISKWIPPDWREDIASHKWTMYVRGDKDNADISIFVSKVRFFLHPSYCPNDVVEVTSYPFHLSRRGWGEFPVRVQLHFKNPLDKPMDIIHHLKLDRTYTGLQMLGSETLVDLWIHPVDTRNRDQNTNNEFVESSVNNEGIKSKEENSNNSEQSTKFAEISERSKEQFVTSIFEKNRVKEEISSLEICKLPNLPIDLNLPEKVEKVQTKVESNDTTLLSNFINNFNKSSLEQICFYINREHDYARKHHSSSHYTVREGNVTIEHFLENGNCSSMTNSSATVKNEEKSDSAAITLHRYNGDIQPSNDNPSVLNEKDAAEDNLETLHVSKHTAFQNNDQKSLLSSNINKLLRIKDSENSISSRFLEDTSVKNMMVNGFDKSTNASFDQLKDLQKATSSSNACNTRLKPLEIFIPPLFASSGNKRILLLKDKKLVPVDVMRKLNGDNVKVPIVNNVAKVNISHGISILKKPPASNIKTNARQESAVDNNKGVLTMKTASSLLLNVNYNIPALKIAESRDLQYNYGLSDATRSGSTIGKQERCAKSENRDEKAMQRPKITLGKDKYKIQSKRELYEVVLRSIENVNISDTEAFVRFIVRRLPIVTLNACDLEYRQLHPYACCSKEEFLAYNIGKQRALEWYRAKMIRCFLRKKQISDDQLWSIKEIIIWTRLHGYTPNHGTFGVPEMRAINDTKRLPDSLTSIAVQSTCTEPIAFQKWLQACRQESSHQSTDDYIEGEDTDIDIETIDEDPLKVATYNRKHIDDSIDPILTLLELDESLMPLHNFVCDTARDIGIKIVPEEIIPGVMYCAASRAMIRVIECFVEDLVRSSLAKAWERNSDNGSPKVILLEDVRNAIMNREEFDIFTNEGLGSRQQSHTTN